MSIYNKKKQTNIIKNKLVKNAANPCDQNRNKEKLKFILKKLFNISAGFQIKFPVEIRYSIFLLQN